MIHKTDIWQRSFGTGKDSNPNSTRLMASFESFRNKVAHLTSRIAAALPHLTIHDIAHLDALWEVTDKALRPELRPYVEREAIHV